MSADNRSKWIEVITIGFNAGDFPVLVNTDNISSIQGSIIYLKDGKTLQLSANGQAKIKEQLL